MNFDSSSQVLIIAAHPDDEVLAMGGTIALVKSLGATVAVKFLGEGVSARFSLPELNSKEFTQQSKTRVAGAKNALALLDVVDEVIFGSRLCCRFDRFPASKLLRMLRKQLLTLIQLTYSLTTQPSKHRSSDNLQMCRSGCKAKPGIRLKVQFMGSR